MPSGTIASSLEPVQATSMQPLPAYPPVRSLPHKQAPALVEQAQRKLAHLETSGSRAPSNSLTSTSVALAPVSR